MGDISGIVPETKEEGAAAICVPVVILEVEGSGEIQIHPETDIGRDASFSEIFSRFPKMSRRHARFSTENGKWFVEDLDSTNGVYLDGVKIQSGSPVEVQEGMRIQFSLSCACKVIKTTSMKLEG